MMKPNYRFGSKVAGAFLLISSIVVGGLFGLEKKIQVISESAEVRLNPDPASPLVGILPKGSYLTLNYSGKLKNLWYYVSYKSGTAKIAKSGYIRETDVECLFSSQKVIDISVTEAPENDGLGSIILLDLQGTGIKKEDFLKKEGLPGRQEHDPGKDIFGYRRKIMGYECAVEYVFSSGRLVQTRLEFLPVYLEKSRSIKLYQELKDWLAKAMGRPENDTVRWQNPAFKYDSLSWGHAVSQGHLEYNALWRTPKSEVNLILSGGNNEIFLKLDCTDMIFKNLAEREN